MAAGTQADQLWPFLRPDLIIGSGIKTLWPLTETCDQWFDRLYPGDNDLHTIELGSFSLV